MGYMYVTILLTLLVLVRVVVRHPRLRIIDRLFSRQSFERAINYETYDKAWLIRGKSLLIYTPHACTRNENISKLHVIVALYV